MGVLSDPRNGILRMKGSCPPRRRPTDESEAVETSTPEHITRIEGTWKDAPRVSSFAHRSHQILEAIGGWKPLRRIDQNPLAVDTLRISARPGVPRPTPQLTVVVIQHFSSSSEHSRTKSQRIAMRGAKI